ncbi:MAG: hypothetical protein ACRDRV_02265 [Pseudonocardiaceae bacterium]
MVRLSPGGGFKAAGEGVIDTERAVLDPVSEVKESGLQVPRLADGTELIGEYQGSGFREPKYIIRRSDGQVIQLPHLLFLLAGSIDGHRSVQQVTTRLSQEFGRDLDVDQVAFLLDNRLRPAGILAVSPDAPAGTGQPTAMRSDPLLSLRFRVGVVPESVAWVVAGIFQFFFFPPVLLAALALFVVLDVALVLRGGFGQLESSALAIVHQPTLTLLVLAMLLISAAFHECGHVAACRYGGARPGRMGFGIYLVWPALYSTVTDAYRLSRRGRLRTDLGGVYFNVVFIAAMSLAYLESEGPAWLLIAIAMMHIETVRQFIPFIRLDGYYILSDLIGVPDLFSRMGPVLKSIIPRREPHPRVQELKPWVRRVVTLWVILVIPALIYFLLPFLILAPRVLPVVWDAFGQRGPQFIDALHAGELAIAAVGLIQMFLLVLPWAGAALIFGMMGRRLVRVVRTRWRRGRPGARRSP